MIAAWPILRRILPYLVAVVAVVAVLFGAYRHGVNTTTDRYERRLADISTANATALAQAQADARGKELAAQQAQADIETAYLQGQRDAQAITDRTIDDLRADRVRLRGDLASAQCALAGVSDIATGTGQRNAACAGGLRKADAEFLVRFADHADAVARQLQAAQAIIESDRKVCGMHQDGAKDAP
ncbi:lysis system i-spanin subunit Rz [Microvirga sp. 17 mud 1-3]|uniref:lysis system i-spanin subunit Rz n=1 Tax=Microvirga sp. 17 mud 1-3 TaxID=2082949 RepID=UPI0013A56E9C|nr:lysis system i-spanin subunit Rz [Microvirga sp. 17 mud 1-3]